jgi:peptidoglycan hydrolase-like protein with peptidoglycan-binding domain
MRATSLFGLFAFVVLLMASPAFADPQPGIAALQVALHARGLYQGALDGRLGPKTTEAVRAFQRRQGLHVDGIPGARTRAALGPYAKYELGSRFLQRGATGWDVAELQFMLASRGLFPVPPNGRYGARTASAVHRYQRRSGLTSDGVAGPATFAALDVDKPPRPAVSPGGRVIEGTTESIATAGAAVDHLTVGRANAAARRQLRRPLSFALGRNRWMATPSDLGAHAGGAVWAARSASADSQLKLTLVVDRRRVRAYVAHVARVFDRPPADARLLGLRNFRPFIAPARAGLRIEQRATVALIVRKLIQNKRDLVRVPARRIGAARTRASFGPVIVVRPTSNWLYLFSGTRLSRVFRVGTGRRAAPTPIGRFVIVSKERDPWWFPPRGRWASHRSPIPPGPGNPLGTRWMGLSVPEVGIHGTPDAASIGYSKSHGCIHMRVPDAEWLFERVRLGTPVIVVPG